MPTLDMNQLARDYIAAADDLDWQAIADNIVNDLGPDEYEAALRQTLPYFLRDRNASRRKGVKRETAESTRPRIAPAPAVPVRSWKVAGIRDMWERRMGIVYAVEGGRKRLGDFTLADIQYQADLAKHQAMEAHGRAKSWESLAVQLTQAGVETVRELAPETARAVQEVAA